MVWCCDEFDVVDVLVILGGEFIMMSYLLFDFDLLGLLWVWFVDGFLVYGLCVGMILLVSEILDVGVVGCQVLFLCVMNMMVWCNVFGSQVDLFEGDIEFVGLDDLVCVVFIWVLWVE